MQTSATPALHRMNRTPRRRISSAAASARAADIAVYTPAVRRGDALMTASGVPIALLVVLLAACANTAPSSRPAQENPTMTSASAAGQAFAPRLDPEQALLRLLDLIEGSGTVAEITPERLRAVFDLPFTERSGRLGYAEQLTSEWWSSYELDAARARPALRIRVPSRAARDLSVGARHLQGRLRALRGRAASAGLPPRDLPRRTRPRAVRALRARRPDRHRASARRVGCIA
jgi:hypothetical protein